MNRLQSFLNLHVSDTFPIEAIFLNRGEYGFVSSTVGIVVVVFIVSLSLGGIVAGDLSKGGKSFVRRASGFLDRPISNTAKDDENDDLEGILGSEVETPRCVEEELERVCVDCNLAEVSKQRTDCSTYTEVVPDKTCTSDCYQAPTNNPKVGSNTESISPLPTPQKDDSEVSDIMKAKYYQDLLNVFKDMLAVGDQIIRHEIIRDNAYEQFKECTSQSCMDMWEESMDEAEEDLDELEDEQDGLEDKKDDVIEKCGDDCVSAWFKMEDKLYNALEDGRERMRGSLLGD